MKWLRENPFLAGLLVVTLLGVAALGYFLSQFMSDYSTAASSYADAVQNLQKLQNRAPFPNDENYKKTKAAEDQYRAALTTLQQDLSKMQPPLVEGLQPQQFTDNLRKAVTETKENARKNNVTLPSDFFLGFKQYADTLPDAASVPVLDRQLNTITTLVNRLIDLKVQSIDELKLSTENKRTEPQAKPQPSNGLQRFPFTVAFTADQSKFRVAFNSLLSADQFFIVRSLAVQNTNPVGPPITKEPELSPAPSGPGNPGGFGAAGVPGAPGAEAPKNNLQVIFGRELVHVVMNIDLIDFPGAPAPKK